MHSVSVRLQALPAPLAERVYSVLGEAGIDVHADGAGGSAAGEVNLTHRASASEASQSLGRAWPGSDWVVLLGSRPGPAPAAPQLRGLAWLPESVSPAALVAAVQAAAAGLRISQPSAGQVPAGEALTAREVEVFELMSRGLSNREIGDLLRISAHTAKFHVGQILDKTGAATRAEAVRAGVRQGLIGV